MNQYVALHGMVAIDHTETGKPPEWLTDHEAADRLNALEAENARLKVELKAESGAHSETTKLAEEMQHERDRNATDLTVEQDANARLKDAEARAVEGILRIVAMLEQPERGTPDEIALIMGFNEEVHKAVSKIRSLATAQECIYRLHPDPEGDFYETNCGHAAEIGLFDDWHFCPFPGCGRPIHVKE